MGNTTTSHRSTAMMVAAAVALLVGITGCGQSADSNQTKPALYGQAELQQAMQNLSDNGGPPGVVTIVGVGDQTYELTQGVANVSDKTAISGAATARIASVSKAFNGAVVLSLASQGKLTLDTPIGTVLPTLPSAWAKATIGQTLQHTSGIPDYIKNPRFLREFIADPQMQRTPEQLIGYVAKQPLAFPPGSAYEYSDTDNIVAGLIAEKISGQLYSEVLGAEVTRPLGLSGTLLPATSAMPSNFIHGYDVSPPAAQGAATNPASPSSSADQPEDVSELINPGLAWASGGMIAPPNNLNTFIRGYLGGELFNPKVLTDSAAFVPGAGGPPGPGKNFSGYGIYRYETACGVVYGHTGNMPGYTSFIAASEDGSRSVVVQINSQVSEKASPQVYQRLLAVQNQAICSMYGVQPSATP